MSTIISSANVHILCGDLKSLVTVHIVEKCFFTWGRCGSWKPHEALLWMRQSPCCSMLFCAQICSHFICPVFKESDLLLLACKKTCMISMGSVRFAISTDEAWTLDVASSGQWYFPHFLPMSLRSTIPSLRTQCYMFTLRLM